MNPELFIGSSVVLWPLHVTVNLSSARCVHFRSILVFIALVAHYKYEEDNYISLVNTRRYKIPLGYIQRRPMSDIVI